jgi:hypothetical protein
MIYDSYKIEFIKQQVHVKDRQLSNINEHDMQLVNSLTKSLKRQKSKTAEEDLHRKKSIFKKIFNNKK